MYVCRYVNKQVGAVPNFIRSVLEWVRIRLRTIMCTLSGTGRARMDME